MRSRQTHSKSCKNPFFGDALQPMARPKKRSPKQVEWPKIRPCYRPDGVTIKSWMVDSGLPINGKRIQKRHLTEAAAKAHAESIRILYNNAGHSGFKISDMAREDAKQAMDKLAEVGLAGTRLVDVVGFYIAHNRPAAGDVTLSDLRDKFIDNRRREGVRTTTLAGYEGRLKQFVNAIGGDKFAKDITEQEVEAYLNRPNISQQHSRNDYAVVSSLFEFAMRPKDYRGRKTRRDAPLTGWVARNPAARIPKPNVPDREPTVIYADTARALLKAAYETRHIPEKRDTEKIGMLAEVVLEMFAGVRPDSETPHLQWGDIEISGKKGTLNIRRSKNKAGIRNVSLSPIAIEWLRLCPDQDGPIHRPKNYRRRWERLKRLVGMEKWEQDCLRHTFASAHFRIGQDAGKTRAYLGHSTSETGSLFGHYRALMSEAQAKAIMALTPAAVLGTPDNIVSIATGAKMKKSKKQIQPKRKVATR